MAWPTSFAVPLCVFNRDNSLMVTLEKLGYKHDDVHLITDLNPWDPPTKENIVSRPYEMLLLPLDFIQLYAMRALVYGARPGDSFFFYCT
jgi:hypothetical protein